jgi:outer membrane protein assembly factor BamB
VIDAIGETGCVNDFAIHGTTVFFTGGFTAVGGQPRNGIAAASTTTGQVDTPFAPKGSCALDGHAIATVNGRVFVGGDGCPIAAFAATTGHQLWAWPRHGNASTYTLLTTSNRVYVGGAFNQLAGVAAHGFTALDPRTGNPAASWHPTTPSQVYTLAASGRRVLIGAQ